MTLFARLFPLWAVLASVLAYLRPALLTPAEPAIVPLLGVVMFAMGITLTPASFAAVLRRPAAVGAGVALQFALMPLLAFAIGTLLSLPAALLVGLVLVGSCPGGTASNVICYLAGGDVALSVTLTAISTVLAVFATPLLTWLYVGQLVPVPVLDMLVSVLRIVILPVVAGVALRRLLAPLARRLDAVLPAFAVAAIVVIIAIIVALNRDRLAELTAAAALAVALHNLAGLAAGYGLARLLGFAVADRRTLAIEVGMQNSGLGVALAVQYFSAAAALPGALFSVWHNLTGSLLAAWWSRRPVAPAGAGEQP